MSSVHLGHGIEAPLGANMHEKRFLTSITHLIKTELQATRLPWPE